MIDSEFRSVTTDVASISIRWRSITTASEHGRQHLEHAFERVEADDGPLP